MIHYHGTPITPRSVLHELAGRNFCVSYAWPGQVKTCHQIGQSVMLDNGAFTFWKGSTIPDWSGYAAWAEPWLDYPTTWCVIPDLIDADADVNDQMLRWWWQQGLPKGAPVWHLHEPIDRLLRLAHGYDERICFGSSGQYREVGSDAWHRRVTQAFNELDKRFKRLPWVHMLRGMSLSGEHYPFASVDSTDIARNHNRPQNNARAMADRWDALQCPARWTRVDQLELEEVA